MWSNEQIMDAFVRNDPGVEKELREVFRDTAGFVTRFDYAEEWIRKLHVEGLRVYCLSNWSDMIWQGCHEEISFLSETDGYILSWREKMAKPDPAIYRLLMDRYGLRAEECVYIDDREENVAAAEALGMCGIVFQNQPQADRAIRQVRAERGS